MIVRELVTRLGFDADESTARRYDESLKKVRNTTLALIGATTALASGLALFARSIASAGNEVAKSAIEAGMAVSEFQELGFVMGRISQVSQGELNRALAQTNAAIQRARVEGGRYADSLKQLGFTQAQINKGTITTSDAFDRVARLSQTAGKEAEAMSAAMVLFGDRIGRRLVPALQRADTDVDALRERFRELGGGFSDEGAKASEEFMDSLFDLQTILNSIRIAVGEKILPIFNDVIKAITEWIAANRELLQQRFFRFIEISIRYLTGFWKSLRQVWQNLDQTVRAFTDWETVLRFGGFLILARQLAKLAAVLLPLIRGMTLFGLAIGGIKIAMVALGALFLEDIWNWVSGNESAIGKILGPWETFRERFSIIGIFIKSVIEGIMTLTGRMVDWIIDRLARISVAIQDNIPGWLRRFWESQNMSGASAMGIPGFNEQARGGVEAFGIPGVERQRINRDIIRQSLSGNRELNFEINSNAEIKIEGGIGSQGQADQVQRFVEDILKQNNRQVINAIQEFQGAEP